MQLNDYLKTLDIIKKLRTVENEQLAKIEGWIIGDILKPKKMLLPTMQQ